MKRIIFPILLLLTTFIPSFAQVDITANDVFSYIAYLASDDKKGRYPCTQQSKQVAYFIRDQFVKDSLKLLYNNGFQYFRIQISAKLLPGNFLKIANKKFLPSDSTYLPRVQSDTGLFKADTIAFIGYGLKQYSKNKVWDDYKNINLAGKWLIMFYGLPKDTLTGFFSNYQSFASKVYWAKKAGAKGIIFINQPSDKDKLIPFIFPIFYKNLHFPILEASRKTAEQILGKNIDSIYAKLKSNPHYHFFIYKPLVTHIKYKIKHCYTQNVVALLKSNNKRLGNRYIVIGAHYDHLGMGGCCSGSRMPDTIAVHNGADDNASGVAGVLELAKYLSARKNQLGRSIIFITFGAEERGSLGSKYFVAHPPVPKKDIDFMINMDMIGQYNGALTVMGTNTSKEFPKILKQIKYDTNKIKVQFMGRAFEGSDHESFIAAHIPALNFFASAGNGYHTPFDDIDKIKPLKEAQLLHYIAKVAIYGSNYPHKFKFQNPKKIKNSAGFGQMKVKLGFMPAFSYSGPGVKIGEIEPNGVAKKSGMQNGDIILKIGKFNIKNIYSYMHALSQFSPGDTTTVTIKRKNKTLHLKVQF